MNKINIIYKTIMTKTQYGFPYKVQWTILEHKQFINRKKSVFK